MSLDSNNGDEVMVAQIKGVSIEQSSYKIIVPTFKYCVLMLLKSKPELPLSPKGS